MPRTAVGPLLKDWRERRNRSQFDLSIDVGVSTRHLSYVENGRSAPSPELVLAIAEHLDVPLRERNTLLLAAGYAPRFSQTPLSDAAMGTIRAALQRMLDAHDPYPGVAVDRQWNIVLSNTAAGRLIEGIPLHVIEPRPNVFRLCLHPDGLAAHTVNFDEWATYLLDQLRRTAQLTGDADLLAIEAEVQRYPNVAAVRTRRSHRHDDTGAGTGDPEAPTLLVPFELDTGGATLAMFTTMTTFGTPRDITLDELSIELFFPADDLTATALRGET